MNFRKQTCTEISDIDLFPCIIRLPDCHTYSIYGHTYSDTKPHPSLCGSHNQQALVGGVQGQRRRYAGCHTSYIKETMVYTLHQPVTLDEAMIPFKGHLTFKQYMTNKPTKMGDKGFLSWNGYLYRIQITQEKTLILMLMLASIPEFY